MINPKNRLQCLLSPPDFSSSGLSKDKSAPALPLALLGHHTAGDAGAAGQDRGLTGEQEGTLGLGIQTPTLPGLCILVCGVCLVLVRCAQKRVRRVSVAGALSCVYLVVVNLGAVGLGVLGARLQFSPSRELSPTLSFAPSSSKVWRAHPDGEGGEAHSGAASSGPQRRFRDAGALLTRPPSLLRRGRIPLFAAGSGAGRIR